MQAAVVALKKNPIPSFPPAAPLTIAEKRERSLSLPPPPQPPLRSSNSPHRIQGELEGEEPGGWRSLRSLASEFKKDVGRVGWIQTGDVARIPNDLKKKPRERK